MTNNGKLEGIGIDFWKLVARKAHIDYKFVVVDKWYKVLIYIKEGKAALTVSTDETDDRKNYAVFSDPYVSYPLVMATKNDVGFVFDVEYLKNKKIAIGRNYTAAKLMLRKYPGLNYVFTDSTDEALRLVEKGKAFCAVDILPVIAYKINKYEFENLKISGQIPVKFKVRFMLGKKYAYLLPKINQAITEITYDEKEKIYKKYVRVNDKIVFTSNELLFYFLIFLSVLIIVALWIYMLIKEVDNLKKAKNEEGFYEYDRLTGLYNKEKFKKIVSKKIKYRENFAVIVFDICDFKSINKFYGHHFGDVTLMELTSLVRSLLKDEDVFARIKGGTFAVLVKETENEACKRAKRMFEAVEKFDFSIVKRIKCCFAVLNVNPNEKEESILRRLDNELIKCKKSGKMFKC